MDDSACNVLSASNAIFDRSQEWLVGSGVVHLIALLLLPAVICGCHFHAVAIPVCLFPVIWGFCTFALYSTQQERLIAYINTVLAIGWIYLGWEANVQFLFR
jgi:hypothetical protein